MEVEKFICFFFPANNQDWREGVMEMGVGDLCCLEGAGRAQRRATKLSRPALAGRGLILHGGY